jgi:RNA polymerase sigma-70 factor, ECF subfamily
VTDADVYDHRGGAATSSSLLIRIQADTPDPEAWQRFVNLYQPLILSWCRCCQLQSADADDVTAEVFRSVYLGVAKFTRGESGGTFRGWLRTITRHAVCNLGRQRAKAVQAAGGSDAQAELQAVPDTPLAETDEERDREEERELLREALKAILSNFKETTRDAFWQVVIEGRSASEVARGMGVEEHVVYLAKSRILKRLRDEYGGLLDL